MALIPFNCSEADREYKDFYDQTGGMVPIFAGAQYQRGFGLGNILSGLMKAALPIVKKGAMSLGKTALRTGLKTAQDAISGKNVKSSFLRNVKDAGNEVLNNSVSYVLAPQRNKGTKRKLNGVSSTQAPSRKRRKRTKGDIFS